jgi:hypothetical protein
MVEFDAFKRSLLSQLPNIKVLENFRPVGTPSGETVKLATIPAEEIPTLARRVWFVIEGLDLSRSSAKTVIGSKALHHLLPELIPPIDRRYTIRFFLNRTNLPKNEFDAFDEIFARFHRIAAACTETIESLLATRSTNDEPYGYMRTSATKVIDNAIVGYGIERLAIKDKDEGEG